MNSKIICAAVRDIYDYLGEYAGLIADGLFNLLRRHEDEGICSDCLKVIVQYSTAQEQLFTKLSGLFELVQAANDEEVKTNLLITVSMLRNPAKMQNFGPFVPHLISMVSEDRGGVRRAAGSVLVSVANQRPDMLVERIAAFRNMTETHNEEVKSISQSLLDILLK